ncbi:DUF1573 domain-containing protein [Planctomycetota bacterium]
MRNLTIMFVIVTVAALILTFSGCNGVNDTHSETLALPGEPTDIQTTRGQGQAPRLQAVKTTPRRSDAGHLSADFKNWNFGVVEPSIELTKTFTLTNDGTENLTITSVSKSCNCTTENFRVPVTLKPGQSVPLEIKYNSGPAPGISQKQVTLAVKPPAQPEELTVSFTANIKKLVLAQPEILQFELRDSAPKNYDLTVESTDDRSFTIASYSSSGNAFQLGFDKNKKDTKHNLSISNVNFEKLRSTNHGYLNIRVTHPRISDVMVPFRAIPPFSVFPPVGRIYNLEPGKSQTTVINVVSNFREDFELGKITTDKGLIEVKSTTKTTDGYGYRIIIELTPPKDSKKVIFDDQLTIKIADRPRDTLIVPCYGHIKPTLSPEK